MSHFQWTYYERIFQWKILITSFRTNRQDSTVHITEHTTDNPSEEDQFYFPSSWQKRILFLR